MYFPPRAWSIQRWILKCNSRLIRNMPFPDTSLNRCQVLDCHPSRLSLLTICDIWEFLPSSITRIFIYGVAFAKKVSFLRWTPFVIRYPAWASHFLETNPQKTTGPSLPTVLPLTRSSFNNEGWTYWLASLLNQLTCSSLLSKVHPFPWARPFIDRLSYETRANIRTPIPTIPSHRNEIAIVLRILFGWLCSKWICACFG
jgi:hypothetical protein